MNSFSELLLILLLFTLVWVFWESIFIYPIKLLTILFHEAGHALATVATGGKVKEIVINKRLGGLTLHQGGNRFLILNAGYLGSILLGFLFFYLTYTKAGEHVLTLTGLLILLLTLLWVKTSFTMGFCILTGMLLIAAGVFLTGAFENFIARFIGLSCILYSVIEISKYRRMLEYYRGQYGTDAEQLQSLTGVHAMGWAIVWSILSFGVLLVLANLMITGSLFLTEGG